MFTALPKGLIHAAWRETAYLHSRLNATGDHLCIADQRLAPASTDVACASSFKESV